MKRFIFLLLLLAGCSAPAPAPLLPLSLSATATEGQAPLEVRFFAEAEAERYTWTVSGQTLSETSPILLHTFESPGLYVIGVRAETSVAAGSESVTVAVTAGEPTEPPPLEPGELIITEQTLGGPAPWAVRYDVLPLSEAVRGRCSDRASYRPLESGALRCVHLEDEVASFELAGGGEVPTQRLSVPSEVTSPAEGVGFLGRWQYRSRGVTETFEIVRGSETSGWSADGRFRIFTIRQNGVVIVEFTIDGGTVVLEPLPEDDGQQVYFAGVYGLELERLDPEEDTPSD